MSVDTPSEVATNIRLIDVEHLGNTHVIASCLLESPTGAALIDPGPTATLETLRSKLAHHDIAVSDLTGILLTHIHLDHAGATGSLVRENPGIRVYVHERGAPHMVDPSRLIQSATRLYGDEMDRLWGPFLPVPVENVTTLAGGERLDVSGRRLDVAYTPGHASHHVSYLDDESGIAFVGDTGGIRIANLPHVLAPTPPPDIDLEVWKDSLARIADWRPVRLFLTHFGPADGVTDQIAKLWDTLQERTAAVRRSLQSEGTDEERMLAYEREMSAQLRQHLSEADAVRFEAGVGSRLCWAGLARYLRKRGLA